jgi:hypothetical protein
MLTEYLLRLGTQAELFRRLRSRNNTFADEGKEKLEAAQRGRKNTW